MTSKALISDSSIIHATAEVGLAAIGPRSRIQQFCVVADDVQIGDHCDVGPHCVIEKGVSVGNRVRIGSGVHLAAGTRLDDDVTIAANCVVGEENPDSDASVILRGCWLGANVTVLAGNEIGQSTRIEAGSVVTQDVAPGVTVSGNPATILDHATDWNHVLKFPAGRESSIVGVQFLTFQEVTDIRGTLTVCQWNEQLPFAPRRAFFLHGVPNENVRGAHAHKECAQALVCFNGSVNVLLDDGTTREEYTLNDSGTGLVIPPGIWATQYRYSENAMLVVFASHDYDAEDYIRNYQDYLVFREAAIDSAA